MNLGIELSEKTDDPKNIDEMMEKIDVVISEYGFQVLQYGDWDKFRKSCIMEYEVVLATAFNQWCEVTKEQIDIAMLMPCEYKEENEKFYVKQGMLDGYIATFGEEN